jgi:hypothetical protein
LLFLISKKAEAHMQVAISILLAILAIVSGLVAAGSDLSAKNQRKRRIAWTSLSILFLSTSLQTAREIKSKHTIDLAQEFQREELVEVDEASGAVELGGHVYVVDDDSNLYEFNVYHKDITYQRPVPLVPCAGAVNLPPLRDDGTIDVTELEAAAQYNGKLLLLSSHSPNEEGTHKPKRELLLELVFSNPKQPCVGRATTLNPLVTSLPAYAQSLGGRLAGGESNVNFEGLAVDPDGKMVIGLRSPILNLQNQPYALVLATTVTDAFAPLKNASPRALRLGSANEELGITDMAYDKRQRAFVVIGNATMKASVVKPRSWLWTDSGENIQKPLPTSWTYSLPDSVSAKPEALALVANGAFVFLDAPRFGGVRWFSREALGLRN